MIYVSFHSFSHAKYHVLIFGVFLVRRDYTEIHKTMTDKRDKVTTYIGKLHLGLEAAHKAENKLQHLFTDLSELCERIRVLDGAFSADDAVCSLLVNALREFREYSKQLSDVVKQTALDADKVEFTEMIVQVIYISS